MPCFAFLTSLSFANEDEKKIALRVIIPPHDNPEMKQGAPSKMAARKGNDTNHSPLHVSVSQSPSCKMATAPTKGMFRNSFYFLQLPRA